MTKKSFKDENSSLSISESYFDIRREPNKYQLFGDAIDYLYKFIDWCFKTPQRSYHWTRYSKYCHSIGCNCSKCTLIDNKKNCKIKEDVRDLIKYVKKNNY